MPPETEALGEDGSNSRRLGRVPGRRAALRLGCRELVAHGHEIDLVVPSGFHDSLADEPVTLHRLGVEFSPASSSVCTATSGIATAPGSAPRA